MGILPDQLEAMRRMAEEELAQPASDGENGSPAGGDVLFNLRDLMREEEERVVRADRAVRLRRFGMALAAFVAGVCIGFMF